jgi:hypothetical protein
MEGLAMRRVRVTIAIVFLLGLVGFAQASSLPLVNNGGGLIWDPNLGITWYQYPSSNNMIWAEANTWAQNQTIMANGVAVTGWRLPNILPINGSTYNNDPSYDGSSDNGYNNTSPKSELAYLFYVELGNKGYISPTGLYPQPGYGFLNKGPFANMSEDWFWSSNALDANHAWDFGFDIGEQVAANNQLNHRAWLVHDGNIGGSVPIPPTNLRLRE